MTRDEFREAGKTLLGIGWQTKMAHKIGYDRSSVKRWAAGDWPVPIIVALWIECELELIKIKGEQN